MSNSPTVVARDLAKTYYITSEGEEIGLSRKKNRLAVSALKPLSFIASSGEFIGVLGRNGSGKSTLMSLIAGNETPTSGEVYVTAQPTMLSVSAALQSHLTGVQNVRMGLLAKGLPLATVKEMELEVAEWADIGDAIHRPLKTYSSGMGSRLRFAISTAVHPEVLLVDEALATGDATFNARAKQRMSEFLEDAATVFLVSHSISDIRSMCTRAIWLHDGEMIADGDPMEISKFYNKWSQLSAKGDTKTAAQMIRRMQSEFEPQQIVFDHEAAELWDEAHGVDKKRRGWRGRHRKK